MGVLLAAGLGVRLLMVAGPFSSLSSPLWNVKTSACSAECCCVADQSQLVDSSADVDVRAAGGVVCVGRVSTVAGAVITRCLLARGFGQARLLASLLFGFL